MSKLTYLVPIVALSLPLVVAAAGPSGNGRNSDYLACKKAVENHFKSPRSVDVKGTYWVKKQASRGNTVLVNAKFHGQKVRGTCNVARTGRVSELTVGNGRFVDVDEAHVEMARMAE